MRSRKTTIYLFVAVMALGAVTRAPAAPTKSSIRKAVKALGAFDYGKSDDPLRTIKSLVEKTNGSPELRTYLEKRLARRLNSDISLAARQFIARELSIIGTRHTVPAIAKLLASDDKHVVEAACYALATNPSAEVDKALRRHLDRSRGRTILPIINLLGQRADEGSAEPLADLARNSKPQVARAAVAALGKIATEEAAAALADIRGEAEGRRLETALQASLRVARKWARRGQTGPARQLYRDLGKNDYPFHIRRGALEGHIRLGGESGLKALQTALDSKNEHLKKAAISQIPRMKADGVAETLADTLAERAPRIQVLLVKALAARGGPDARRVITDAAREGPVRVRVAALTALGKAGTPSTVPFLVETMGHKNEDIAEAARIALRNMEGREASAAVLSAMESAEPAVKAELTGVLAARVYEPAVPSLLKQAEGGRTADVCSAAWEALAKLAGLEHFSDIVSAFPKLKIEATREQAKKTLTAVAARTNRPSRHAASVVTVLHNSDNTAVKQALLHVLTQLPCKRAYKAVEAATRVDDPKVRGAAVRALTRWKTMRAAPRLLEIAEKGDDSTERTLAFRAYVDLVQKKGTSPEVVSRKLATAMKVAPGVDARKRVLGALSDVVHPRSLRLAADCIGKQPLRTEACTAAVQLGSALKEKAPDLVVRVMKRVVEQCSGGQLKKKARGIIESAGK